MNTLINYIKILVPLIFVFLFSQARAEFNNSAFTVSNNYKNDSIGIHKKKYELAVKLYESEDYTRALKMILPIVDEISDFELNIKLNILIAKILKKNQDFIEAKKYLDRINSLISSSNNIDFYNDFAFLNLEMKLEMSSILYNLNKKDSSIVLLKEIIDSKVSGKGNKPLVAKAYNNLAGINIVDGRYDESVYCLNQAISIHKYLNDNVSLAYDYSNLASLYLNQSQLDKAKYFYIKGINVIKSDNSSKAANIREKLYFNLAWALYNLKDHESYAYLEKSYIIRDSINDDKIRAEIKKIERIHNIESIKNAEENKRLRLERNNWIIGVVGILVSLLFLYIANLYKLKQKNLRLKLSENELEQQRKLEKLKSDSQAKIINAAIDGKETERKQIAEILHDNVSALLSSANMHLQATQKQFKGDEVPIEIQKSQQIILEASQKIRELSHNLVSSVLLKFGLEYAIKDAAKKYSNSSLRFFTAISNVNRYAQEYEIKIFNIVQELINNILKHSKAEKAYIAMEEEDSMLTIMVKDDGKGFDTNKSKDGIGLNQIRARVDMLNGSFEIESAKNIGTKIIIKVPVVRNQVPKSA